MQKFTFQKKPSLIRTLKEPPRKKKKVNWDRIIFLSLLFVGGFFIIRHIYIKVAIIEVEGQVELENLQVEFTDDIRIKKILVKEGDSIVAGDTLFAYTHRLFDDRDASSFSINSQNQWIKKEILNTQKQIANLNSELAFWKNQINNYEEEKAKTLKLILLEVYTQEQLDQVNQRQFLAQQKREVVEQEIGHLYFHLNKLKNEEASMVNLSTGGYNSSFTNSLYISPINGIAGKINVEPNEVCYEKENVLAVHKIDQLSIEAFFPQKYIDRIYTGRIVDIHFPDGTKGKGKIHKFNIATIELPPEFQKKYEPTQRTILVSITPIDADLKKAWKNFYKMDVKVTMPMYEF